MNSITDVDWHHAPVLNRALEARWVQQGIGTLGKIQAASVGQNHFAHSPCIYTAFVGRDTINILPMYT